MFEYSHLGPFLQLFDDRRGGGFGLKTQRVSAEVHAFFFALPHHSLQVLLLRVMESGMKNFMYQVGNSGNSDRFLS